MPEGRQSVAPDQRPAMAVKLQPYCFAHAKNGTLPPVTSALWLPVTQMSVIFLDVTWVQGLATLFGDHL